MNAIWVQKYPNLFLIVESCIYPISGGIKVVPIFWKHVMKP